MNSQRINITLPNDLVRDLRLTIPDGKRSRFIAEAVKESINKKKNLKKFNKDWAKSLRANRELYKEINKDWAPLDVENWPE